MSKKVLHQHTNKSLNKSQNREAWTLGELLLCDVLGVILPPCTCSFELTETDPAVLRHLQTHTHKQDGITAATEKGS